MERTSRLRAQNHRSQLDLSVVVSQNTALHIQKFHPTSFRTIERESINFHTKVIVLKKIRYQRRRDTCLPDQLVSLILKKKNGSPQETRQQNFANG